MIVKDFETFRELSDYDVRNLTVSTPSAFNGEVNIKKYRVLVEEVVEDQEILQARFEELWRKTDNHHHYSPIQRAAKSYGINLNAKDFGKDSK